jgi:hypothetical protein
MPIVDNPVIYAEAKRIADAIYDKPSAYKSGYIVRLYKDMGGTYTDDEKPKGLTRWFKEKWKDVAGLDYPVFRPTRRVSPDTPLTPEEISPRNLKKQIALKQIIRGESNLPKFIPKKGGSLAPYKPLPKSTFTNEWVESKKSKVPDGGWGVFAKKDIPKGTKIEDYYGEEQYFPDFTKEYGKWSENPYFTYPMTRQQKILVAKEPPYLTKNITNYINEIPSVENARLERRALYAIKDIPKGEELSLKYTKAYPRYWMEGGVLKRQPYKGQVKPSQLSLKERYKIAKELNPITREEAVDDFHKLEEVDLSTVKPLARTGNKTVDYFTYPERLNTQGKGGLNYFDVLANAPFFEKKAYIQRLLKYLKEKNPSYSHQKRWNQVFNLYFSAITIFKPLNAMIIYEKYKPKSVLDFTMGWGGRLVGACALDVPNYIGIDLNKNLEKPYKEMVKLLSPMTETKIKLYFKDALKIDYSKLDYDLVFTSPPYYNKEIYSGTTALTKEEWDEQFYIPIFEKTWSGLKKGGHFVMNVPPDVYTRVLVPLLGKADEIIPFTKVKRQKGGGEKYNESVYSWKK